MDYLPAGLRETCRSSAAEHDGGVPPIPAEVFHVNVADMAWVDRLCVNQPLATFEQRVRFSGGLDQLFGRTVYISASKYQGSFHQFYDKFSADLSWRTYSVESGHDIMIDAPEQLADILEEVG